MARKLKMCMKIGEKAGMSLINKGIVFLPASVKLLNWLFIKTYSRKGGMYLKTHKLTSTPILETQ